MSKKKKRNSDGTYDQYPFLHHVDDENKIVYVFYRSWAGSMGAHTLGKKYWPGYEIRGSSQDLVEYLNGEDI